MTTLTRKAMPRTITEFFQHQNDQPIDGREFRIANNTTATYLIDVAAHYDVSPSLAARGHFGGFVIRLHGNAIAIVHQGGDVSVRHCGYVTATTFDRLHALAIPIGWRCGRRQGVGRAMSISTGETITLDAFRWTLLMKDGGVR